MRKHRFLLAATCPLVSLLMPNSTHAHDLVPSIQIPHHTFHHVDTTMVRPGAMPNGPFHDMPTRELRPGGMPNSTFHHLSNTMVHPNAISGHSQRGASNTFSGNRTSSVGTRQSTVLNLDLSSQTVSNAPAFLSGGHVIIDVGNKPMAVTAGTKLTPAEQVAAYQVMRTGKQSIVLDSQGSAVGGTVILTPSMTKSLGSLVIPDGVKVIDVTKTGTLNVAGNITDDGNLTVIDRSHTAPVTIDANNIIVQQQGTLTDVNRASSPATDMTLNAGANITNNGTISSSGTLNLNVGTASTGSAAASGTQSNAGSSGGTILNSGLITSSKGDINIGSSGDANINAPGGTFSASNGSINIRNSGYTGNANTFLTGGNYLSSALNLNSGSGTANTNVQSIGGTLNVNAGAAHTLVSSGNLQLGTIKTLGDPTFYNADGNITVQGNISVGEALTLAASGNILSNGNYNITASDGATGFQINLIAGANITQTGSSGSVVGGGAGTPATTPISINGASATGGNVTFSGHDMTISSAGAAGNGGDVNIVAYENSSGANGRVLLSQGTSISTGGSGSGTNGNVTIIAGANQGTAVSTGTINTSGGTGGGGDMTIQTAQPAGNPVVILPNGSISSGAFHGGPQSAAGSVSINGPITSGGNVDIRTSQLALNGSVSATTSGATITASSSGNLTLSGQGTFSTTNTGATSFLAPGSGSILSIAPDSAISIAGGGNVNVVTPNLVLGARSTLSATGASNIYINPGNGAQSVDMNVTGPARGAGTISTNGGTIDVSAQGLGNVNFSGARNANTTINLNAGSNGLVDVHGLGNITINKGVLLSTNSPIMFNMNNAFGPVTQKFTLNGTVRTTASNAPFPDPLGGNMYYSILVQNLVSNFTLAGTGTFLQAGATPGNTVFNDFTDVGFANGTRLNFVSLKPGSYTNFYTRQIQLEGSGQSLAAINLKGVNGVNFNTNLPSFAPGDMAFVTGPGTTSARFLVNGAPVAIGFKGAPPVSIPTAQQPIGNLTVGPHFSLVSTQPIAMYATNSVNILGQVLASGGNGQLSAQSPSGASLNVSGNGLLSGKRINLSSTSSGTGVNFAGLLRLNGSSLINAPNGSVTIDGRVLHHGPVIVNSPNPLPVGFVPSGGVIQTNQSGVISDPRAGSIVIDTPNLNVGGAIEARM